MSQALSNLIGISVPLSPRRSRDSGCNKFKFDVKAQAATGESRRDKFDHLQRANSKHHQPQSKKRVAPVPPVGTYLTSSLYLIHSWILKFRYQWGKKKKELIDWYVIYFQLIFRVMGQVSYSKNSAADDGDNGEDVGGAIRLLGGMAIAIANRDRRV